jgi:hypothetical protein
MTAVYVLAMLVGLVAWWLSQKLAWESMQAPTLVQQWRKVWAAPVIKVRVK